jgi:hypothetical protein
LLGVFPLQYSESKIKGAYRALFNWFDKHKTSQLGGFMFEALFLNGLVASIWHEGHETSNLDSIGNYTLMFVAELGSTGRFNLEL